MVFGQEVIWDGVTSPITEIDARQFEGSANVGSVSAIRCPSNWRYETVVFGLSKRGRSFRLELFFIHRLIVAIHLDDILGENANDWTRYF